VSTEPGESLTFNSSHTGLNELELDKSRAKTKPTESGKSPNFKLSRAGLNELHAELDKSTKNTDHNACHLMLEFFYVKPICTLLKQTCLDENGYC
jgi:hypothetical protein